MGRNLLQKKLASIFILFYFGVIELHTLEKLALGKAAYQTDVYHGCTPDMAVDGSQSQSLYDWTCSHTTSRANASWEVDLGRRYFIHHVTIYNRQDYISDRLRDVELYIGRERNSYQRYGYHEGVVGSVYTFQLAESVVGQWVQITRIPSVVDYLTLCEVQVFVFNAARYFRTNQNRTGIETCFQTSMTSTTIQQCGFICYKRTGCEAAYFNEETHMCEMFTSDASKEAAGGTMLTPYYDAS